MKKNKAIIFVLILTIAFVFVFLFYKTSAVPFEKLFSSNKIEKEKPNLITKEASLENKTMTGVDEKVEKPVSIIFVGDIMLSRNVDTKIKKYKDYNYPYKNMSEYLKTGDIVFGNLETAITPGRAIKTGEMTFRADPENTIALKENGFNILSLANNHTPNFGEKGLKDTINYLERAGIKYVGAGN